MKNLSFSIFTCLFVFFGTACANNNKLSSANSEEAAKLIDENKDYCGKILQMGMSKETVKTFLPPPQNTNNANVWVWVFGYSEQEPKDWHWLCTGKGGFFLVFTNGHLATPICANAAFAPPQALMDYGKMSAEKAEAILYGK